MTRRAHLAGASILAAWPTAFRKAAADNTTEPIPPPRVFDAARRRRAQRGRTDRCLTSPGTRVSRITWHKTRRRNRIGETCPYWVKRRASPGGAASRSGRPRSAAGGLHSRSLNQGGTRSCPRRARITVMPGSQLRSRSSVGTAVRRYTGAKRHGQR